MNSYEFTRIDQNSYEFAFRIRTNSREFSRIHVNSQFFLRIRNGQNSDSFRVFSWIFGYFLGFLKKSVFSLNFSFNREFVRIRTNFIFHKCEFARIHTNSYEFWQFVLFINNNMKNYTESKFYLLNCKFLNQNKSKIA